MDYISSMLFTPSMCQTLLYFLFLCAAAGLDANNQASTHELTIPNDVSICVLVCDMSSRECFFV